MTLTANQSKLAYALVVADFLEAGSIDHNKPDIKLAITDADAWASLTATRQDYNTNLTASDFKSTATDDEKTIVLQATLEAKRKG